MARTSSTDPTRQCSSQCGTPAFRASFGELDAHLVIDGGAAALEASTRVESISIGEPAEFREHVVRGSDFFAADKHPRISFRSTRLELADDGTASAHRYRPTHEAPHPGTTGSPCGVP